MSVGNNNLTVVLKSPSWQKVLHLLM